MPSERDKAMRRRPWQFSLQTSFAAMTLTCVVVAVVHYIGGSNIQLLVMASVAGLSVGLAAGFAARFFSAVVVVIFAVRHDEQ